MKRLLIIVPVVAAIAVAGMAPAQAEEPPLVQTAEGIKSIDACPANATPLGEVLTTGRHDGQYADGESLSHFGFTVEPGQTKEFTVTAQSLSTGPFGLGHRVFFAVYKPDVDGRCRTVWSEFVHPTNGEQQGLAQTPVFGPGEYWMSISEGGRGPNFHGNLYTVLANA